MTESLYLDTRPIPNGHYDGCRFWHKSQQCSISDFFLFGQLQQRSSRCHKRELSLYICVFCSKFVTLNNAATCGPFRSLCQGETCFLQFQLQLDVWLCWYQVLQDQVCRHSFSCSFVARVESITLVNVQSLESNQIFQLNGGTVLLHPANWWISWAI